MDSILTTIKSMIGITAEQTHFDPELIMHINSAISVLTQLGAGPDTGFYITTSSEEWGDFIDEEDIVILDLAKQYIGLRVKVLFDPPSSSYVLDAMNKNIDELGWRISVAADKSS